MKLCLLTEIISPYRIPVFNAPYSNTRSVAELVIAEAILLARGIPQKNAECHRGGWSKSALGSVEVRGKTLGVIGYGHIGTQIGVLAEGLGMQVIYHDIETKLALGNARAAHGLDDLLARADIVTLHVPETPQTKWMIGEKELAKMKPGALLLNAARGARVPDGRHEYTEYFLTFGGNGAARFTPSIRYSIGRFYNGYRRSYAAGPSMHINERLSASLNLQVNDISLPAVSYVSTLATTRINYNFNTKMFLNALLQYTTDTHQLSSNIRFNVIHRPLSDFFFVYNEHRDERLGIRRDRSLIAKLTYMLAM